MSNDPNGEFPKNTRTHAITKSQAEEIIAQADNLMRLAQTASDGQVLQGAWFAFEARVRALVSP